MKSHDEMYQSLLSRYNDYQVKKKRRMIVTRRIVSLAACFTVIFSGYQVWSNIPKMPIQPPTIDEFSSETSENNVQSSTYAQTTSPTEETQIPDPESVYSNPQSVDITSQKPTESYTSANPQKPIETQNLTIETIPSHTEIPPTTTQTKPVQTIPPNTKTPTTTVVTLPPQTEIPPSATQTRPAQTTLPETQKPTVNTTSPDAYTPPCDDPPSAGYQTTITQYPPLSPQTTTVTTSLPQTDTPSNSTEAHFEVIPNVQDKNGKMWNHIIFVNSGQNVEQKEHSFEAAGFTTESKDEERNIYSLKHESGFKCSIYMMGYDDFYINQNPNVNYYLSFYEINGKKVVRERYDPEAYQNVAYMEYCQTLIIWDDGCHICFTNASDLTIDYIENLIANQITY